MENLIENALRQPFANDAFLLEADVAERAIAARIAFYLAPLFPRHQVDVEYNRHGIEPKIVNLPEGFQRGGRRLIYPDMVVHQRGHDEENILVIQIKRETNAEPRNYDHAVIEALKREFRYARGLLIDLPGRPRGVDTRASLKLDLITAQPRPPGIFPRERIPAEARHSDWAAGTLRPRTAAAGGGWSLFRVHIRHPRGSLTVSRSSVTLRNCSNRPIFFTNCSPVAQW